MYESFFYEQDEVKVVKAFLGSDLQLKCPERTAKKAIWFRAGGEQIMTADESKVLTIEQANTGDLGVYFCAGLPAANNISSGHTLSVKKLIVVGDESKPFPLFYALNFLTSTLMEILYERSATSANAVGGICAQLMPFCPPEL